MKTVLFAGAVAATIVVLVVARLFHPEPLAPYEPPRRDAPSWRR